MKLNHSTPENRHQQYDDHAFEQLFKDHFKALYAYAYVILKDEDDAEEIVQNMFLKFWEKRDLLTVQSSLKAYLYKCVYNDSLNFLKHQKIKTKYQDFATYTMNHENEPASSKIEMTELTFNLNIALNRLPEQCRTIFQMSRFEELKYKEIAERLGLSVKTIENQMGKALRILRLELADFLSLVLLGLMYYKDYFN
ncbi:RNA polymerase sigma-70 factor [Pedobacter nyackensis]|uniref:RNA polymerase sigma-70 factor, ECF subfamily n=1 Tax=Pedobacter nyackensis TaxID=475255 RepID=A0A1W2DT61_9SPHI|nr:RNA polymerase sigma-70 factor [Pedobacter nyackensis]SMD00619.1 RNA polymerase sigma-70 factor, ECF subfamily [Pedobacter nyackensis]